MKSISISDRLIFYFVLIGVVSIIFIGAHSYYYAKKALLNRTFDQLTSLRLEKKNRIEQFFLDRVGDVNLISQSEEIRKIAEILNSRSRFISKPDKLHYDSYLSKYIGSHGYYQQLHIVGQTGFVYDVISSPGDTAPPDINRLTNTNLKGFCEKIEKSDKTIIHDLTKSDLLIYIGTKIWNEKNEVIGYVTVEIPSSAVNRIMFGHSENNGLGETGETYLVGDDYLMRSNSRFKENAVLNIKVTSASVLKAFNGETGHDIVQDYRNISCLSSYSKVNIEGLNWVLLAEMDEKEAMTPIYSIRNSILLISVAISGCVFVFAFLISRKITSPLKQLQKASEEIGEGNYNVDLSVSSEDELGLLTETFNQMISKLKKQSEEIAEERAKKVRSLIDGQEMERQRLSRDLHDSLGQSILAVKIKLEQAKGANSEKNQQIINETLDLLRNTIHEIRSISTDLMPPVLDAFGIEQGLKTLCKDTTANTGIPIEFSSEQVPAALDRRLQIYLYRISQEAINNISKHSGATAASMSLSCDEDSISLNIADNGSGFDAGMVDGKRNGIVNIRQRVELLKGTCALNTSLGKGTQIKIKLPMW